jgi:predicted Ser/Thr protein kinase
MALKKRFSLEEFLDEAVKHPSWFFNAHQALYAAVDRKGRDEDGKWNFVKDRLFGLDENVNMLMDIIKAGTHDPEFRSKMALLIGQTGTGKTETTNILVEPLIEYRQTEEGALYKLKLYPFSDNVKNLFDDEDQFEKFKARITSLTNDTSDMSRDYYLGSLNEIRLGYSTNIGQAIYLFVKGPEGSKSQGEKKLEETIEKINGGLTGKNDKWRKIELEKRLESSSIDKVKNALLDSLREIFVTSKGTPDEKKIRSFMEKAVVVEEASNNEVLMRSRPQVAVSEKNLDYQAVFGGKVSYKLIKFVDADTDSPLVINYGIAGGQNMPSPAGGMVVFSEVQKAPESFLNTFLDLIQDRQIHLPNGFTEPIDSVFMGTTNLDDYSKIATNIKDYFMGRTYPILYKSILRLSDAEKALDSIFSRNSDNLGFHYSPRFLTLMKYIWVMAGLDKEPNIPLVEKAEMYNGNKKGDNQLTAEELQRKANSKSLLEITEGVRFGLPYRAVRDSVITLLNYSRKAEAADGVKKQAYSEPCLDSILGGGGTEYVQDLLNTMEGLQDLTKQRISSASEDGKAIINSAFEKYRLELFKDVAIAYTNSEETLNRLVSTYVIHSYMLAENKDRFLLNGVFENVDKDFLDQVNLVAKVPPDGIKKAIQNHIKYNYSGKTDPETLRKVGDNLLEEFPHLIDGIIASVKPKSASSAAIMMSDSGLKDTLKNKFGYCEKCANVAISVYTSKK